MDNEQTNVKTTYDSRDMVFLWMENVKMAAKMTNKECSAKANEKKKKIENIKSIFKML